MQWAPWRTCLASLGLSVLFILLEARGANARALAPPPEAFASVTPADVVESTASNAGVANVPTPTASVQALRPTGLLTARSLRVAAGANQGSRMFLGPTSNSYSIGTDASGSTFSIKHETDSTASPVLSLDAKDGLHIGAQRVEAQSLATAGGLSIRGVKQWMLVSQEDFTQPQAGWMGDAATSPGVTQCGGVHMLGGYCKLSKGELSKTFTGLPPHKQVRIVGKFHFIDRWIGETGYMKLNIGQDNLPPVAVWSEQHMQSMSKNGLNLCGQASTPEGKFSSAVDVTVEHTKGSVQVTFGSTMEDADPCDESWGVSGIEIYTRN